MNKSLLFSLFFGVMVSVGHAQTLFSFDTGTNNFQAIDAGDIHQSLTHSSSLLTSQGCDSDNVLDGPAGGYITFDDASAGTNFFAVGDINQDLTANLGGMFSFYWFNGTYDGTGDQDGTITNHRMELYGGGGELAFVEIDVTGMYNDGWQLIEIPLTEAVWSGTDDLAEVLSNLDSLKLEVESGSFRQFLSGNTNLPYGTCSNAEYMAIDEISFVPQTLGLVSVSEVTFESNQTSLVEVYPNPVNDFYKVSIVSKLVQEVEVNLYSSAGVLVENTVVELYPGKQALTFERLGIASGVYNLQISMGSKVEVEKLVFK